MKAEDKALFQGFKGQNEPINTRPSDLPPKGIINPIEIKPGVVFKVLRPEIYVIFPILASVFGKINKPCVITSANDSDAHKEDSKHYQDLAVDIRTKHLESIEQKTQVVESLRIELGANYRVLFEGQGTDSEHIHIGFYS